MKRLWYKIRYAYYFYRAMRWSWKSIWEQAEAGMENNYDDNPVDALHPKDAVYEELQAWRD